MTTVELIEEVKQASPAPQPMRSSKLRYDLLLVLVTMIWGSTFLVVKDAVKLSGPFIYLGLCYGVGAVTLALVFRKRLMRITRSELLSGVVIGACLFTGYALQTVGLQLTTVSKAGFITGLYVPLVPVFAFFFLRQKPALGAIMGMVLSFAGLCLLSIDNRFNLSIGPGELLILGAAFAFAMHIVCINKFAPQADATNLAIVQVALTSVLSFLMLPIVRERLIMPPFPVWAAVLFMGVIDIAFCLLAMNRVQQFVSGTRAALIYALEPVWAALAGYLLAHDSLSISALVGCGCILLGMIAGRIDSWSFLRDHLNKFLSRTIASNQGQS